MSLKEFDVIKAPVITERSTILREKFNQYIFRVNPKSSKYEIRQAVEKIFKVNVENVRTAIFSGKMRRLAQGRPQGRRPEWKKAIVTVQKGQEIKIEQEAAQ